MAAKKMARKESGENINRKSMKMKAQNQHGERKKAKSIGGRK